MAATFAPAPEFSGSAILARTADAGRCFAADPAFLGIEYVYPVEGLGEVRAYITRADVDRAFAHGLIVIAQ